MCSAVGASLARATGFGEHMIVPDKEAYERRAIALAHSLQHDDTTEESPATHPGTLLGLRALRRKLVENRMRMPLFDTARWTRNLETGYVEAWRRWVAGTEFEGSDAWRALPPDANERRSGCIYIRDDEEYERVGEHSNT
jgi:protein O-GlcNAc transferase